MMKNHIELSTPCQEGFAIAVELLDMQLLRNKDWRRIRMEREAQEKHLQVCTICNPDLLVNLLFGDQVVVTGGIFEKA